MSPKWGQEYTQNAPKKLPQMGTRTGSLWSRNPLNSLCFRSSGLPQAVQFWVQKEPKLNPERAQKEPRISPEMSPKMGPVSNSAEEH